MDILLAVQGEYHQIPPEAVELIAAELKISKADLEQTISFYHFFSQEPVGAYAIYLNNSVVACLNGREAVAEAFEKAAGISFNSATDDSLIGLWDTADIGMNDQEPAAIINGEVFTNLDPAKAKAIIKGIKAGKSVKDLAKEIGGELSGPGSLKTMVKDNLLKEGPVLFSDYEIGSGLKKALDSSPDEVIEEVKASNLRGRGGAGFPAGMKWDFCRKSGGDTVYLVCNADEGEPGTFKERVLLTQLPRLLFEGMAIAGYAIDAKLGVFS